MKVRDSGMPEENLWATFFDVDRILTQLQCADSAGDVVEFGCGYGTFTIAVAARTCGMVFALDVEPEMLVITENKARAANRSNVRTVICDFVANGTGLPDNSCGYAMLFNILHTESPIDLLREAFRVLQPGGKVGMIHWNYDARTPRGPDLSIRPRPGQCQAWTLAAGFELSVPLISLPPYHYGLVGHKPSLPRPHQQSRNAACQKNEESVEMKPA